MQAAEASPAMEEQQKKQVTYELLGEPMLLYRHAPSYTLLHNCTRQPTKSNYPDLLVRWKATLAEPNRVKARFYDPGARFTPTLDFCEDYEEAADADTATPAKNNKRSSEYLNLEGTDAAILEQIRKKMFPKNAMLTKTLKFLDQTYRDPDNEIDMSHRKEEVGDCEKDLMIERGNAAPEYLAPFGTAALEWGFNEKTDPVDEVPVIASNHSEPVTQVPFYGPLEHGNCLVSFQCPSADCTQCLVHPTGEMLSKVCISSVHLPTQESVEEGGRRRTERDTELEIGERILQIVECAPWGEAADNVGYFVVRSSNYTTLIRIRYTAGKQVQKFKIKLVKRIDLRSLTHRPANFRPRHVAAHPKYGDSFTEQLVAIVSHSDSKTSNVIHCGVEEPLKHIISNLQRIELAEFSTSNPMVLHAAATSYIRPTMVPHLMHKRPMLGHGSSLYTIDLRSNKATFQWSPSAEQFVMEGFHSISGILSDWDGKGHSLFASSTTAGKMFEIDARMPCKTMNSWHLPGLCQNMGVNMTSSDLHGGGTLLHLPRHQEYRDGVIRPIYSVDKSLGAFGLSVYQQPLVRSLLGTASLELLSSGIDGAARSSMFPLPDVSRSVFTCGITSFRDKVPSFLTAQHCSELGYSIDPEMALSVVTMTNNGDLYCHTLLETNDSEQPRAVQLDSGATGLQVKNFVSNDTRATSWTESKHGGFSFRVCLRDTPAVPSAKLLPINASTRSDCEPFDCVPFPQVHLRKNQVGSMMNISDGDTSNLEQATRESLNGLQGDTITAAQHPARASGQQDLDILGDRFWKEQAEVEDEPSTNDSDDDSFANLGY
mmetsp:Transcript_14411/g.23810  ORF Transcript_14411/g.23810 Transcript_14411/m.23810 type:complete len:826 (-) Transcript_14411:72-2549(-)|eukprot:CAMPEP_0119006222 /NCGR_PEP_ID=MMETSP1176-20130426/2173_1 /TAXON_ID=265551 /ORGANISM="Synedropsis recta cf, Strain CCMP1620" /LENGTH=825 /DNA_ID=CAMNT_0006958115 /DNA_START=215 /DNA_END=2692 /DNA_ORIENTATION=-